MTSAAAANCTSAGRPLRPYLVLSAYPGVVPHRRGDERVAGPLTLVPLHLGHGMTLLLASPGLIRELVISTRSYGYPLAVVTNRSRISLNVAGVTSYRSRRPCRYCTRSRSVIVCSVCGSE